jgi:hypothetical protein
MRPEQGGEDKARRAGPKPPVGPWAYQFRSIGTEEIEDHDIALFWVEPEG